VEFIECCTESTPLPTPTPTPTPSGDAPLGKDSERSVIGDDGSMSYVCSFDQYTPCYIMTSDPTNTFPATGDVVYTDPGFTIPFIGGNEFWKLGFGVGGPYIVARVSGSGVILNSPLPLICS